jgi:hypothetical protein
MDPLGPATQLVSRQTEPIAIAGPPRTQPKQKRIFVTGVTSPRGRPGIIETMEFRRSP